MATLNASQGKWNTDMEEAFCSSPPVPTPAKQMYRLIIAPINRMPNRD